MARAIMDQTRRVMDEVTSNVAHRTEIPGVVVVIATTLTIGMALTTIVITTGPPMDTISIR